MPDARYILRVLPTIVAHPLESADRIRQRSQIRREGEDRQIDYGPRKDWEAALHQRLGTASPCPANLELDTLIHELEETLPRFPYGHDADGNFARAVFCIARHSRAQRLVETGVARGITSRFILEATREWDGRLWSIDLPPMLHGFHGSVGAAVTPGLRERWTYVRGSSQRKLRPLLEHLERIDVFVQDSVGTRSVVFRELSLAWAALRPGGWMAVGGINRSEGFQDFLGEHRPSWSAVAPSSLKTRWDRGGTHVVGQFAMLQKSDYDRSG